MGCIIESPLELVIGQIMTSQEVPALVGLEEGEGGEAGQVDVLLVDQLRLHADVVDQELAGALHG